MIEISQIAGGLAEGDRDFEYELPVRWFAFNRSSYWGNMVVEDGETCVEVKVGRDSRVVGVEIKSVGGMGDWPEVGEGLLAEGLPVIETGWDAERHFLQRTEVKRKILVARREKDLGVFWGNPDYLTCVATVEKATFLISVRELVGVIFSDMTDDERMIMDEIEMTGGR